MERLLKRVVSVVRVWLGWDQPSTGQLEPPVTPPHGWLLPAAPALLEQRIHAGERESKP